VPPGRPGVLSAKFGRNSRIQSSGNVLRERIGGSFPLQPRIVAMFRALPFLAIVVILYNVIVLFTNVSLDGDVFKVGLPSGADWNVTTAHMLISLAVILLFIELLIATASRAMSMLNHGLSMVVFIVCVLEFVLVRGCGTSVFFIITLINLIDVVAGYSISIVTARRDIALGHDT
jgi:hypothetical protein